MRTYESALSRVRAMYRLPATPDTRRALEVRVSGSAPILDSEWRQGTSVDHWVFSRAIGEARGNSGWSAFEATGLPVDLRVALEFYDFVLLHQTMDRLSTGLDARLARLAQLNLLRTACQVMAPGAVIAGSVTSFFSLSHIKQSLRQLGRATAPGPLGHSPRSLRSLLTAAGVTDIEVFTLSPGADSPAMLVETNRPASVATFQRIVQARRSESTRIGYIARLLLAQTGRYGYFAGSLVFWGRKGCSRQS